MDTERISSNVHVIVGDLAVRRARQGARAAFLDLAAVRCPGWRPTQADRWWPGTEDTAPEGRWWAAS